MDAKALPKTLYKYRSWDDKNHRRMVWHDEIYFASPASFNDPFDCKVPFRYDLICEQPHDEQVIFYAEAVLRSRTKEAMAEAEKEVHAGFFGDVQRMKQVVERDIAERDRHGIFTVSVRRDQMLMWSHYANAHKGFCVGFDTHWMGLFLGASKQTTEVYDLDPKRVLYRVRYPLFIPSRMGKIDFTDYLEGWFRYKATTWRYEREYRYVIPNVPQRVVKLWPNVITEVILGCRMWEESKEDVEEIKSVLNMRESKPKLFRAAKKKHGFGLDIVEV